MYNTQLLNQKPYQITALQDKVKQLENLGRPIINATIGDPKDDTPEFIPQNLIESLTNQSFSQYPKHIGSNDLREAISTWADHEYKCKLDSLKHVISCNGTKEAIFSFPLLFDWMSRKQIIIPSLSYPIYKLSAAYFNIPIQEVPLSQANNFLPDLSKISKADWENTQLFWLNSPHNPTSTVASYDYIKELVSLAEKYDFLICSDECYNDLYHVNKPASVLMVDSKHWICFRSLSKRSHMTGYRSGAIISKNTELISLLSKIRSAMGVGTPSFIQSAATSAWLDTSHVNQHRELYNQKRQRLIAACKTAGLNIFGGDAGFYLWLSSNEHDTSESLFDWFLERNIFVTPGTVFGDDGNPYVRMVFCLTDSIIDECVKRILS